MGVSLERVQNKFACIIGELCSEPDILSEFAIWLDLRLAEYKSKGSISLECSGEAPSPSWLRGHKGPPKRIKQRESTLQIQPHYEPSQEYNDNLKHETTHERLSPELVYIKEEPAEVFPVSVHSQEEFTPSRNHARKRSAPVPSSEIADDSPYKMHKLSSSSSILEPVNQSLMSIISESGLDESAEMSADMSADFSIIDTPKGNNSLNPIPSTSTGESSDLQVQDDINSVRLPFAWQRKALGLDRVGGSRGLYKSWSEEHMELAVTAVLEGRLTRNQASDFYRVPKTSIYNRMVQRKKSLTLPDSTCTSQKAQIPEVPVTDADT